MVLVPGMLDSGIVCVVAGSCCRCVSGVPDVDVVY